MAKRRSETDRRARQSQRIGRALRLLCLIQERHGRWDLPSLARELGCSTKTVQRDLLALEEARIPFFFDKQRCCYKINPGFQLSILDYPSNPATAGEQEVQPPAARKAPTPGELAESSREHAERILCETELLIERLTRLCQALRLSNQTPDTNGPKAE